MTASRLMIVLCVASFAASAAAQTPSPQPAPPQRAPEERPVGQPVNVRIEVTIIDEGGPHPSRKTVSVTVADRQSGQVRSAVDVPGIGRVPLALDAFPIVERDGRIRTRITLEYQPSPGADRKEPTPVEMRLSFGVILDSGRKVVAAQAADPVTDRRVSAEVTATVLK